jgi:hypothetical protein
VGPQAQSPIGVQNEALDFALIQDSKMTGKFTGRHSTHMAGPQLGGRWRYRSPCRQADRMGPFRGTADADLHNGGDTEFVRGEHRPR